MQELYTVPHNDQLLAHTIYGLLHSSSHHWIRQWGNRDRRFCVPWDPIPQCNPHATTFSKFQKYDYVHPYCWSIDNQNLVRTRPTKYCMARTSDFDGLRNIGIRTFGLLHPSKMRVAAILWNAESYQVIKGVNKEGKLAKRVAQLSKWCDHCRKNSKRWRKKG